jgi:two-component system response regulator AtoC
VDGAALIVEIAPGVLSEPLSVVAALNAEGLRTRFVRTLADAVTAANDEHFDVIVLAADSVDTTALIGHFDEPVVIVSGGGAKAAVDALRAGAADFLETPVVEGELRFVVGKVLAARRDEVPPVSAQARQTGLLGESRAMQHVQALLRRVAPGNATVMLRGESGTGKELLARAIHAESPRAAAPFVKVHCAGLPETLFESELFGYEKGAFTGASARKPGRVEVAEGGTLFFDEIGDISPAMQVKLLRLLQDREFERLGGTTTLSADVRFIAATHRDLEHMTKKGQFREDLFYRLNVVPIWLPPLRARRDDVPMLARHFCEAFARAHGNSGATLSAEAIALLTAERWPGNVRQLQNFVERLVVLSESRIIGADDVRRELAPPLTFATQTPPTNTGAATGTRDGGTRDGGATRDGDAVVPLDVALREAERRAIERALKKAKGNRTLAARLLGVGRATLYKKLVELGIPERR